MKDNGLCNEGEVENKSVWVVVSKNIKETN